MNIISPSFREEILEGNNKTLYTSDEKGVFILYFKEENPNLAIIRKKLSTLLFKLLSDCGVKNHLISSCGIQEQKVIALEMLPFIFSIHSFTNAYLAEKFYLKPGMKLKKYLTEIYFKDKKNTLVSKEHILNFGWLDEENWNLLVKNIEKIMDIVYSFFYSLNISVFSIKLEFGKHYKLNGKEFDCILGDEISLENLELNIDNRSDLSKEELYYKIDERFSRGIMDV